MNQWRKTAKRKQGGIHAMNVNVWSKERGFSSYFCQKFSPPWMSTVGYDSVRWLSAVNRKQKKAICLWIGSLQWIFTHHKRIAKIGTSPYITSYSKTMIVTLTKNTLSGFSNFAKRNTIFYQSIKYFIAKKKWNRKLNNKRLNYHSHLNITTEAVTRPHHSLLLLDSRRN